MASTNPLIRTMILSGACVALFTAGCATTNQVVSLNPQVNASTFPARGLGRSISLEVIDTRPSPVIGYRGASDAGTEITAAAESVRNIRTELERTYRQLGFNVVPAGSAADIRLRVELADLSYARESEGLLRELNTGVALRAESVTTQRTVTGTYRDGTGRDATIRPSMRENLAILNEHLSTALTRLVADAQLTGE